MPVKPALGFKYHAECARRADQTEAAEFIEAQNAEIEYLYAALQAVHRLAKVSSRRNKTASAVRLKVEAVLRYEQGEQP